MDEAVQAAAREVREVLAAVTDTLGLGGSWPEALPLGAIITCMFLVLAVVSLACVALIPLTLVLAERWISAWIQDRRGPIRVGPWGTLQTIADGIKLLLKEDIIPPDAHRPLFRLAPYIVFAGSFAVVAVVPPFSSHVLGNNDLGVFIYMALSSAVVLGILMAGWSSNSKYSLLGAMRAAAQMVSYEIPLGLAILMVVMTAGTLNMQELVLDQTGGIHRWYALRQPFLLLGCAIYFLAAMAETNRTPFDLPEAESELVAGFHTEYSGIRFAFFFLAEYANLLIVSAICTTLFLGGWSSPIPALSVIPGIIWFLGKSLFLVFVVMWLRWTVPRVRVDQLMNICWKYFLPIGFVCILGTGVLVLADRSGSGLEIGGVFLSGSLVAWIATPVVLVVLGVVAFAGGGPRRRRPAPPTSHLVEG